MDVNDLKVNTDEILRYLGYTNQNNNKTKLIDECIEEIKNEFTGKYIYKTLNIEKKEETIDFQGTVLKVSSKDLSNHLNMSDKCIVMAATLGNEIDRKTNYYIKTNITKGIIFDACATEFIEKLCDYVELQITKSLKEGELLTTRFSPGYGDLEISAQQDILNILDAYREIGLSINESFTLIPKKSVTAIIGISKHIINNDKCMLCIKKGACDFRNRGDYCGI